MRIPHTALASYTLHNLVEEFVTREGTDYGAQVYSLADKVSQVLRQLDQGRVVILYDPQTGSCQIELADRVPAEPDNGNDFPDEDSPEDNGTTWLDSAHDPS